MPAHTRIARRSRNWHPVVIAMALCALVLRLAPPAPLPAGPEIALIAAFGEHALCLSGAANGDRGRVPASPAPARDQHDKRHDLWCCQWHAASAVILPGTAAVATFIRFATDADRFTVDPVGPPSRPGGPAQARAPPVML